MVSEDQRAGIGFSLGALKRGTEVVELAVVQFGIPTPLCRDDAGSSSVFE